MEWLCLQEIILHFWQNSNLANQVGIPGSVRIPTGLERYRQSISNPGPGVGGRLAGNAGNILSSGIAFGSSIGNAFAGVKSASNILDESGTSYSNGIGYGYQKVNDVDYDKQLTEVRKESQAATLKTTATGASLGASVGSIVGPIGSVIGGAIGAVGGFITGFIWRRSQKEKDAKTS